MSFLQSQADNRRSTKRCIRLTINLINGDSFTELTNIPDNSVHCAILDPPYNIQGMGLDWDHTKLTDSSKKATTVKGLPVGMAFKPEQGQELQDFMFPIAQHLYRILLPGAFAISFSQARLYHHMAMAFERANFELRDMLGWTYSGQAKAFSQDHFIRKRTDLTSSQKTDLIQSLDNRKTPQLRPCIEPMTLAQKPKEGTFVDNWINYSVGLIDVSQRHEDLFPGNLMPFPKPTKQEKGDNNLHFTVKPVGLIEHLIKLFTTPGQTIIDPFLGSGTTALASKNTDRSCIGIELNPMYYSIAQNRLL